MALLNVFFPEYNGPCCIGFSQDTMGLAKWIFLWTQWALLNRFFSGHDGSS